MAGPSKLFWGRWEPDGSITVLGETDASDALAEPPAEYLQAVKRGTNVCFDDLHEDLLAKVRQPAAIAGAEEEHEGRDEEAVAIRRSRRAS